MVMTPFLRTQLSNPARGEIERPINSCFAFCHPYRLVANAPGHPFTVSSVFPQACSSILDGVIPEALAYTGT